MIYIPGTKFKAGAAEPVKRGGSLLEQKTKALHSDKGSPFKEGQIYILYHIKRNLDGSYVYQFKKSDEIIEIPFKNRRVAEDYIARISGQSDTLKSQRESIRLTNER